MRKILFFFFFLILTAIGNYSLAQVNAPYINTGVTFQWDGPQPNNNAAANIVSITINGDVFDLFAVPTAYEMTQLGPSGHGSNNIRRNGGVTCNNSGNACWLPEATAAFQSTNLNYYFEANPNGRNICNNFGAIPTTDAQKQSLIYDPPLPANQGGIIAVTERGGNNCFHVLVEGTPPGGGSVQTLGQTFVVSDGDMNGQNFNPPAGNSHYWQSGRTNENGQSIGIALYNIEDLVPAGSLISRVQLTAATNDHGDGKFFVLQKYAVNGNDTTTFEGILNGNVFENDNVPIPGSTYTIATPPPSNGTLILNPDGTYTYTPDLNFIGLDSFTYEVCLPVPNDDICDQATEFIVVNPIADINLGTSPICLGQFTDFTTVSSGTLASYGWDFGEDAVPQTSSVQNPEDITWTSSGTKTITLVVSGNGVSETFTEEVIVNPTPELSSVGGDSVVFVGSSANVLPSSGGTWVSSETSIATINNSGDVNGISEGVVDLIFTDGIGCSETITFTVVQQEADLSITKTVNNSNPEVGEGITFTITVINNGPNDATDVIATDMLPSGYTYVSDNGGGSYNPTSGIWNIGGLNNGASVSLDINVTVNNSGNYLNYVTTYINDETIIDPDLTNNSDSEDVEVECIIRNVSPNINNN